MTGVILSCSSHSHNIASFQFITVQGSRHAQLVGRADTHKLHADMRKLRPKHQDSFSYGMLHNTTHFRQTQQTK